VKPAQGEPIDGLRRVSALYRLMKKHGIGDRAPSVRAPAVARDRARPCRGRAPLARNHDQERQGECGFSGELGASSIL
jgi:hypothetical protein